MKQVAAPRTQSGRALSPSSRHAKASRGHQTGSVPRSALRGRFVGRRLSGGGRPAGGGGEEGQGTGFGTQEGTPVPRGISWQARKCATPGRRESYTFRATRQEPANRHIGIKRPQSGLPARTSQSKAALCEAWESALSSSPISQIESAMPAESLH